eukprot:TRINITY_DN20631_c0_g1_i1.p2 TRINITY_DN20631_c0_g1~~TRINITY_DN20631_c0_g1_i1.p2  ORF type:complete len:207 (-),score=29.83 TRINITY_DN20631_c0_g1_i1:333-953(-)
MWLCPHSPWPVNRNPLLAGIFRDTDRAFSDLAVQVIANMPGLRTIALQVHLGAAVPPGQVRWHFDGPNSLLHMAISLQGSRNLHYILSQDPTNTVRELFWYPPIVTQGWKHHHVLPQHDGSLYVTSPFAFEHGVEYPAADWSLPIVAVQCRLLFTAAEAVEVAKFRPSWAMALRERLSTQMEAAQLQIPSLDQVLASEAYLVWNDP